MGENAMASGSSLKNGVCGYTNRARVASLGFESLLTHFPINVSVTNAQIVIKKPKQVNFGVLIFQRKQDLSTFIGQTKVSGKQRCQGQTKSINGT